MEQQIEKKYSPVVTGKKSAITAGTVSAAGILAIIVINKLQPILTSNGIVIDQMVLIVAITAFIQSLFDGIKNWWKNRHKGKVQDE